MSTEEIERLLQTTGPDDQALRAAVIKALESGDKSVELWRWVVAGLLLLATIALAGLLYLIGDGNPNTQPELALTAFVGILGGLLGLLVGAPWRQHVA